MADDAVPFRSLYRRFRPQRFADLRGQDHVVRALTNAVRDDHVGHAYLFSGPRGTGKTSTARILAKALNCEARDDGEPCGACASCVAVEHGTSLDVHELDAASNNGVDAMRELVSRAALGTPGRRKVYIVDEVHMLSTAASNALLKTLEEPPAHVVFVLATTDPQKVLPTIRSRTQHFEFRLLGGEVLTSLVADVNAAAGLGVAPEAIDLVVARGKGSARDALSVLDQVAAAGEVEDEAPVTDEAVEALCERDAARALLAVAQACALGRDARRLAADLVEHLHNAFLLTQAPSLVALPDEARERLAEQAHRMGPAGLVRAIETLGRAQVDMREALDPRVTLDAALVRLARPDADTSVAALVERIERLERALATAAGPRPDSEPRNPTPAATQPAVTQPAASQPAPPTPRAPTPAPPSGGGSGGRSSPSPHREPPPLPGRRFASPPGASAAPRAPRSPVPTTSASPTPAPPIAAPSIPGQAPDQPVGPLPSRDALTKAWGDVVLGSLSGRAKARFGAGRFSAVEGGAAVFAVPNEHFLSRCEEVRCEVEAALTAHFATAVRLRLVVERPDEGPTGGHSNGAAPGAEEPDMADLVHDDEDGGSWEGAPAITSPEERLKQAFPGAEEVST